MPEVRQALVHAASVLSTRDRERGSLLTVDMRPLVIHLLDGLQRCGIQRAVVTLGERAAQIEEAVRAQGLTMAVEFVHTATTLWPNLAQSIVAARAAFRTPDPLLIVRADQLYDWRLLSKVVHSPFDSKKKGRIEAYALVDTMPQTLEWAAGAHCSASCRKNGRCQALAKVLRGEDGHAVRIGHRLHSYDAVIAGDVYATLPSLFALLTEMLSETLFCTIADAMQELASRGALGCIDVGELSCHWFGSKTVLSLFAPPSKQQAPLKPWTHVVEAARTLLLSTTGTGSAGVTDPSAVTHGSGGGGTGMEAVVGGGMRGGDGGGGGPPTARAATTATTSMSMTEPLLRLVGCPRSRHRWNARR